MIPRPKPGDDARDGARARTGLGKPSVCTKFPTTVATASFEHFPLFAPAFDRRPYFREKQGAVLLDLDLEALAGRTVQLSAVFADPASGKLVELFEPQSIAVQHRRYVKFEFSLASLPVSIAALVNITLRRGGVLPDAVHVRELLRSPPPSDGAANFSTFQVDHTTKALLKDGITFVMNGWFAGGYGHESAGLPPSMWVPRAKGQSNADMLSALGQASLVTEWGKRGHTFVRAGSWTEPAAALAFLDAANAAGLSVLWNVGIDTLARAMAGIPNSKTNTTG